MGPGDVSDVTHHKRGLRILGFEKKQGVEFLPPNERVEIQTWARPNDFVRYGRCALVGLRADDVKAVSIKRVCLSLSSCWKTFKLKKVNKSFIPEPISCFQIPIYVYEHFMNIIIGNFCRNLVENKISMEGIYYDKRYAPGKTGQDSLYQSLK